MGAISGLIFLILCVDVLQNFCHPIVNPSTISPALIYYICFVILTNYPSSYNITYFNWRETFCFTHLPLMYGSRDNHITSIIISPCSILSIIFSTNSKSSILGIHLAFFLKLLFYFDIHKFIIHNIKKFNIN